jgi:hypothetical protein
VSEFNSPLGRLRRAQQTNPTPSFQAPNPAQQRTFMVTDEREDEEVEQDLRQKIENIKEEKVKQEKYISSSAKERLEIILGLGRSTVETEFEGVKFTLRSLKSYEMRDLFLAGSKGETNAEAMWLIRNHTVAKALEKIDGQPVSIQIGSKDFDAKLAMVEEMDEELVEFLHRNYKKMLDGNKAKFKLDEDVTEEVVSDLKK